MTSFGKESWSLAKASPPLQCISTSSSAFAGEWICIQQKFMRSREVRRWSNTYTLAAVGMSKGSDGQVVMS